MIRKLRNDGVAIDVSSRLGDPVAALAKESGLIAVYLYGSYGTPYQTPLSDVDLALIFRIDRVPDFNETLRLIGLVTGTLHEDDVSVTILNKAPLPFQFQVLSTGRRLLVRDEIAHADFLEFVIDRYGDFALERKGVRVVPQRPLLPGQTNGGSDPPGDRAVQPGSTGRSVARPGLGGTGGRIRPPSAGRSS